MLCCHLLTRLLLSDTPGGNWARAVQAGTQLKSVRDYPEKIAHLNQGQCLLICDETSIPTVANLIENWQNTIAPIVIVVTNDDADTAYLQDIELSQNSYGILSMSMTLFFMVP